MLGNLFNKRLPASDADRVRHACTFAPEFSTQLCADGLPLNGARLQFGTSASEQVAANQRQVLKREMENILSQRMEHEEGPPLHALPMVEIEANLGQMVLSTHKYLADNAFRDVNDAAENDRYIQTAMRYVALQILMDLAQLEISLHYIEYYKAPQDLEQLLDSSCRVVRDNLRWILGDDWHSDIYLPYFMFWRRFLNTQ